MCAAPSQSGLFTIIPLHVTHISGAIQAPPEKNICLPPHHQGARWRYGDNANESMSLVWQHQSGRGIFHTHRCCYHLSGLLIIVFLPTLKTRLLFTRLFTVVKLKAQERMRERKEYLMFIYDAATCVFRSIIHYKHIDSWASVWDGAKDKRCENIKEKTSVQSFWKHRDKQEAVPCLREKSAARSPADRVLQTYLQPPLTGSFLHWILWNTRWCPAL